MAHNSRPLIVQNLLARTICHALYRLSATQLCQGSLTTYQFSHCIWRALSNPKYQDYGAHQIGLCDTNQPRNSISTVMYPLSVPHNRCWAMEWKLFNHFSNSDVSWTALALASLKSKVWEVWPGSTSPLSSGKYGNRETDTCSILYSCTAWTTTETLLKKLDAFDQWCLRRILRMSYTRHTTSGS